MPEKEPAKEAAPVLAEPEEKPAWVGSLSATEEIIAPDGHVVLSKEDIAAAKGK